MENWETNDKSSREQKLMIPFRLQLANNNNKTRQKEESTRNEEREPDDY